MADKLTAFSIRDIATRDRLEDYAADALITTAGGLTLRVAIVADGAGGGEAGELAARLTARTVIEALQISTESNVPRILTRAVERANAVVFSELRGAGTSTVGVLVVNMNDNEPYGRLYCASVGNTRLYLVRDNKIARLNIDHTLSNEYIYAGQMSAEEARMLENADFVTRSIGVSNEVHVDIGIYAERGKPLCRWPPAPPLGQAGVALRGRRHHFAASDGMSASNSLDNVRCCTTIKYCPCPWDDVERLGQALLRYAAARSPTIPCALAGFCGFARRQP